MNSSAVLDLISHVGLMDPALLSGVINNRLVTTESPEANSTCPETGVFRNTFLHGSVLIAAVIIFILIFFEKRKNKCLECCGGRPGLVIPINMVDDYENRWAYAFAFGAVTNTIVVIFTGGTGLDYEGPFLTKALLMIFLILEVCVNLFPFFACLATTNRIAGSILGFLYAGIWFFVTLYFTLNCIDPIPQFIPYAGLVLQLPTLLCLGFLGIWFLVSLGFAIYHRCNYDQADEDAHPTVARDWHFDYVNDLVHRAGDRLSEDDEDEKMSCCQKFNRWIIVNFYDNRRVFKYTSRMFCTLFIVFMCLYQIAVAYFWSNATIIDWLTDEFYDFLDRLDLPANHTIVMNVEIAANIFNIGWQTVTALTLVLFALNTLFILYKYRSHMLKLFRGDRSFVPSDLSSDPAVLLRYCMLYTGYQVGYMIWGFFITNFVMWIIVLLFGFFIVLPAMNDYYDILRWILEIAIAPFLLNFILRLVQKILARLVFLQPKVNDEDDYRPLALDNRKCFHIANYFFVFANIATGLFSCLWRILKSFVLGLLYLGRLDRCVLMAGWETSDTGFCSYIGMIYIEAAHNHPVLRVFCQRMLDHVSSKSALQQEYHSEIRNGKPKIAEAVQQDIKLNMVPIDRYSSTDTEDNTVKTLKSPIVSSRAKKRWHLYYTLINNPQLIPHRNIQISASGVEAVWREVHVQTSIARRQRYESLKKEIEDIAREMKIKGEKTSEIDDESEAEVDVSLSNTNDKTDIVSSGSQEMMELSMNNTTSENMSALHTIVDDPETQNGLSYDGTTIEMDKLDTPSSGVNNMINNGWTDLESNDSESVHITPL